MNERRSSRHDSTTDTSSTPFVCRATTRRCFLPFDGSLLSPVTAMSDTPQRLLGDGNVIACLVTAEVALTRAWSRIGVAPAEHADEVPRAFGCLGSTEPVT